MDTDHDAYGPAGTGNLIGAPGLAVAFAFTGMLDAPFGETAAKIAVAKTSPSPLAMLANAALCHALVCLAVWLTFSARDTTGKFLQFCGRFPSLCCRG